MKKSNKKSTPKKKAKKKNNNAPPKEDFQAGGEMAREEILKLCVSKGVTTEKIITRLNESLDATENKVFYDKDRGRCITGPAEIAHKIRLDATKMAAALFDIMPAEKKDTHITGTVSWINEFE